MSVRERFNDGKESECVSDCVCERERFNDGKESDLSFLKEERRFICSVVLASSFVTL